MRKSFFFSRDGTPHSMMDTQGRFSSAAMKNTFSPYLQKLPHSNFIQVLRPSSSATFQRRRPRRCSGSNGRCAFADSSYQVLTVDHLDLNSFFIDETYRTSRSASVPSRMRSSVRKTKSTNSTFRITIYRNGDRQKSCQCTLTTLNSVSREIHFFVLIENIFLK